jgi:hypothetical protein
MSFTDGKTTVQEIGGELVQINYCDDSIAQCHISRFTSGCSIYRDQPCGDCDRNWDDLKPCEQVKTSCFQCKKTTNILVMNYEDGYTDIQEYECVRKMRTYYNLPVDECCCGLEHIRDTLDRLSKHPNVTLKSGHTLEVTPSERQYYQKCGCQVTLKSPTGANDVDLYFEFSANGTYKPLLVVNGDTSSPLYQDLMCKLRELTDLQWETQAERSPPAHN